jgi:hypothetical protein
VDDQCNWDGQWGDRAGGRFDEDLADVGSRGQSDCGIDVQGNCVWRGNAEPVSTRCNGGPATTASRGCRGGNVKLAAVLATIS